MPASAPLVSARQEIEVLRTYFLPAQFNSTGTYPDPLRVQAHARAFLVLAHAEIETYLEVWAKRLARASQQLWDSSKRISAPLAFLISTLGTKITATTLAPKDTPQRFSDECTALFQRYYKQIKDNHGVKESNVLGLFGPLGVPASAFGTTLLPFLESFGEDRGNHAHHAARAVVNVLDPETEYKRLQALLVELELFDGWLQQCELDIK